MATTTFPKAATKSRQALNDERHRVAVASLVTTIRSLRTAIEDLDDLADALDLVPERMLLPTDAAFVRDAIRGMLWSIPRDLSVLTSEVGSDVLLLANTEPQVGE